MSDYTLSDFCKAYGWKVSEVTMKLDGQFVHKQSGTELGSIFDLKIDMDRRLKLVERELKKEQRAAELNELVPAAIEILGGVLKEAKVYRNKTMPNVELNGIHFYLVIGKTLNSDVIVRFHHPDMTGEQVARYTGLKVKYEEGRENNCIISGMDIDKAAVVIEQIANLTGE